MQKNTTQFVVFLLFIDLFIQKIHQHTSKTKLKQKNAINFMKL